MAVTNPKRSDLTAYAGNTFDFLYTFEDQNAAAIDLSADYNDIEFRIFQSSSKASPYVSLTVGSGLSITNTNELSGTITASQTDSAPSVLFYEIAFTLSDGSTEVYLFGRFFVNNFTGDGEKTAEFTITVNQNTNTVTFSESYDAAAKATQAKVDAEAAESSAQTIANNFDGDFDISNLQAGDILRAEDVGGDIKLVRKNETDFLQKKTPFDRSAVNASGALHKAIIWDSFQRPDAVEVGMADSGQSWVDLVGDFEIKNNAVSSVVGGKAILGIQQSSPGSRNGFSAEIYAYTQIGYEVGLVIWQDSNNYLAMTSPNGFRDIKFTKTVAGATTTLASKVPGFESRSGISAYAEFNISQGASEVIMGMNLFGTSLHYAEAGDLQNIYENMTHIGIYEDQDFESVKLHSVIIRRTTQ